MRLFTQRLIVLVALVVSIPAQAVTFDWATVGNPGNSGELSGTGAGGIGLTAIVGGVDYIYNISKHEVTAGQYTEFLNSVAASDPYKLYNTDMWTSSYGCKIERTGSSGSYTYTVAADRKDRPVNIITWGDAARFTNWLHNGQPTGPQGLSTTENGAYFLNGATSTEALLAVRRNPDATYFIPSEDEWYKAAYFDPTTGTYFDYPTGSNSVPNNDLLTPDPGNSANFYLSDYTIDSPYWTTPVGEFENSASPYGTFDQGGNVWEWNEAILYGSYRGVRGGSFVDSYDSGSYLHAADRPTSFLALVWRGMGFRVASLFLEPSADFDGDGDVDGRDFLVWQRNPSLGDLADWQANYGAGSAPTADSTTVPEPATWALLLIGLLPVCPVRKTR